MTPHEGTIMERFFCKRLALLLSAALLLEALAGCGTAHHSARDDDRYASLPYADAATFAVPADELSAALVKVLSDHGYPATITDTTQGTIRGELTADHPLRPEELFRPVVRPGVLSAIGTFLGIVFLISLFAKLTSQPAGDGAENTDTSAQPDDLQNTYHYVVVATVAPAGDGASDVSLSFDRLDYLGDEMIDASPIEQKGFNYALFDALREELDRGVHTRNRR
jgi:hypothetical protein